MPTRFLSSWLERSWKLCTSLRHSIDRDVDAVVRHDPAARSRSEAILTYPGLHAIWVHRAAHTLWRRDQRLAARLLAHGARFVTGVEIHPGARLGEGVFIDHGMGVVIGETATVGDGCVLFKGVVLGGTQAIPCMRHPQLANNVVVGSNACVLGNIHIGAGARIGSGAVVVRDVPEGATVVGIPGRIVPHKADRRRRFEVTLDHADLPDPINEMLRSLRDDNERLCRRLEMLERQLGLRSASVSGDPCAEDEQLIDADLSTADLPEQHGG